jgi:xylulokinase
VRKGHDATQGDAFLAALAVGDVSREAIKTWNPATSRIEPEPANVDLYRRRYDVFRAFYARMKDLMAAIGT